MINGTSNLKGNWDLAAKMISLVDNIGVPIL